EAPRLDAVAARVRAAGAVALPGDDEVALAGRGDRGSPLTGGGVRVDLELGTQGRPVPRAALRLDAVGARVRAARAFALPGDDKVALAVDGDRGMPLPARGVRVDLELGTQGRAVRRVALRLDAVLARVRAARTITLPGDDEVALAADGDRGKRLVAVGVRVDLELGTQDCAVRRVALRLDAVRARVRAAGAEALPRNDEVALAADGQRRSELSAVGVRVDLELDTQGRAVPRVAPRLDAEGARVRAAGAAARPGDDEAARAVDGHRRTALRVGGVRVDLELGSVRRGLRPGRRGAGEGGRDSERAGEQGDGGRAHGRIPLS